MGHLKITNKTGQRIKVCNQTACYVIDFGVTKDIPVKYDHHFGRVKQQRLLVEWHKKPDPFPLKKEVLNDEKTRNIS